MKRHAARLGFDACGVARAGDADPEDRLGRRLAEGYHADMAWLADTREIRRDVRRWLADARSVVVVARNYYAPRPAPAQPEASGRVARYAWGRDYHRVLRKPVRALAGYIESLEEGAQCAWSIDTGPVLEKAWAARAGIGWIGKNSLVLRPGLGSWFFLSVIATTVEIAPDAPMADQCGSCTLCIEACPTGAIVAPRTVDARRCISYHTVEHRGAMPPDVQAGLGDWLFGCDVCQEVCPWNATAATTSEPDFHPRPGHANPELDWLAQMDDEAFREAFAGTPILRAKRAGVQRTAKAVSRNRSRHPGD
ncbi:MAG: tRNA epoxyqueuosine(34) reductase QueG [Candidatus Hydrogenedentes bacterium]|nr:tRNA epoxyqueuosine(34) reductase QueG [Candidatus Hydrogenedentota bacterium]